LAILSGFSMSLDFNLLCVCPNSYAAALVCASNKFIFGILGWKAGRTLTTYFSTSGFVCAKNVTQTSIYRCNQTQRLLKQENYNGCLTPKAVYCKILANGCKLWLIFVTVLIDQSIFSIKNNLYPFCAMPCLAVLILKIQYVGICDDFPVVRVQCVLNFWPWNRYN
jgi:hypothetical protein